MEGGIATASQQQMSYPGILLRTQLLRFRSRPSSCQPPSPASPQEGLPGPEAPQALQHLRLPKGWISQTSQHLAHLQLLTLKKNFLSYVLKEKFLKWLLFWNIFLPCFGEVFLNVVVLIYLVIIQGLFFYSADISPPTKFCNCPLENFAIHGRPLCHFCT